MKLTISLALLLVFAASPGIPAERIAPDKAGELICAVATGKALFFDLEPAFSDKDYALKLTPVRTGNQLKLTFSIKRTDRKPFKTLSYGVRIDSDAYPCFKDAGFYREGGSRTAGNRNPPMFCILDDNANCVALIGFADQIEVAETRQDGSTWRMSRPAEWETITAAEIKDGVYLDLSGDYWFDALSNYAHYADEFRGFKPRPIPPQAYEPVWCSWYTLTCGVNEQNIWENAVIAKSLGFGTILIDAGWDMPGDRPLGGETTYGDRFANRRKFPDMAGMVDRIHKELGLAVELWAAPWSIGKKSRAEKLIADARTRVGEKQIPHDFLCPRTAKSADFLAKNLADVFTYYHIDGMWWDFIDSIPIHNCRGHKHDYETYGQGYQASMTKIVDAVRKIRPDALIEIRLGSSNINNKLFANVQETYDTPLYYPDNRALLAYVRTFGPGFAPKTDPTMWLRSKEEGLKTPPDELVGRYMATMITAGVPAVSQDFTKMPESNKRVVKAYLDFYHAHKRDLSKAEFRPVGSGKLWPHYFLEGDAAYLYSDTPTMPRVDLKRAHETIYLFNTSEKPEVKVEIGGLKPGVYAWQARNHFHEPTASGSVEVKTGGLSWTAPVPSGGMMGITAAGGR